ncbi:hypothetical protein [Micromonospora sp. DT62]|uniref:hypothetical protein n=1 Tax=Micromonospora sp. DT62 TaxID=3416521 RepID=UPI003CEE39B4
MKLNPGDVLLVTKEASVQFTEPMSFRLIKVVTDWITYDGWLWLDGYQLDAKGTATAKRRIFVQRTGLRVLTAAVSDGRIRPPQRHP